MSKEHKNVERNKQRVVEYFGGNRYSIAIDRVSRGGYWGNLADGFLSHVSKQDYAAPSAQGDAFGFRFVLQRKKKL
jgi:hypothetical protein